MVRLIVAALLMALTSPVAAQEYSSANVLRAVIEDLRDGTLDDVPSNRATVDAIRKHKDKTRKFYQRLGPVEDITYWDTFNGRDLYLVSFKSGRVVYQLRLQRNGEIRNIKFRTIIMK